MVVEVHVPIPVQIQLALTPAPVALDTVWVAIDVAAMVSPVGLP